MNEEEKEQWEFGLLPIISEAASDCVFRWMDEFSKLSAEAKKELIDKIIDWLHATNSQLANAITGTTEGVLDAQYDSLAHKLTKEEWDGLMFAIRFAQLVVLRALNEALREKGEDY